MRLRTNELLMGLIVLVLTSTAACGQTEVVDLGNMPAANRPPCDAAKSDCDGDGRIGSVDCSPHDATSFDGAPEVCADGKDNDCDGIIDEGCSVTPPIQPPATVDSDNDTFPDGPEDCAPHNARVHPAATEMCADGVDNNCNGVIDEGCPVPGTQPIPPPRQATDTPAELSCTFSYQTTGNRTVSVQAFDERLDLGGWWDKSESSVSSMSVNVKYSAPRDVCGFRLNVAEGNPPGKWLCEGNGSTALLDTATSVYCTFDGRTATRADLRTWSAPGGSAAGCSAVWLLQPGVPGCW